MDAVFRQLADSDTGAALYILREVIIKNHPVLSHSRCSFDMSIMTDYFQDKSKSIRRVLEGEVMIWFKKAGLSLCHDSNTLLENPRPREIGLLPKGSVICKKAEYLDYLDRLYRSFSNIRIFKSLSRFLSSVGPDKFCRFINSNPAIIELLFKITNSQPDSILFQICEALYNHGKLNGRHKFLREAINTVHPQVSLRSASGKDEFYLLMTTANLYLQ